MYLYSASEMTSLCECFGTVYRGGVRSSTGRLFRVTEPDTAKSCRPVLYVAWQVSCCSNDRTCHLTVHTARPLKSLKS